MEGKLHVDKDIRSIMESEFGRNIMKSNFAINSIKELLNPTINLRRTNKKVKQINIDKSLVDDFINYLKNKGVKTLKSVTKYLEEQLQFEKELSWITEKRITLYLLKFNNNIGAVLKEKAYFDIDKEFIFLNIIDTANVLLSSETKNLLNLFIDEPNIIPSDVDLRVVMETIHRKNIDDKTEDFKYICTKINICRAFPSYTDYFSELTSEFLKLSNKKLHKLVKTCVKIFNIEQGYIETILDVSTARETGARLKTLLEGGVLSVRESLSVLRGIITQRHQLIQSQNSSLTIKTKAIRIFLDIIDKTFEMDGEEKLSVEFDLAIKAIRDWVAGFRNDIDTILHRFIMYTAGTIKKQWNQVAEEESKTLLDIILDDKSANKEANGSLITKGSNFILSHSFIPIQ